MSALDNPAASANGLRERLPAQDPTSDVPQKSETAQEAVRALNEQESNDDKDEKDKKTYGRTPDGTGASFIPAFPGPLVASLWNIDGLPHPYLVHVL